MKKLFIDLKKEIYKLWENNLELSNFTKLPKDLDDPGMFALSKLTQAF